MFKVFAVIFLFAGASFSFVFLKVQAAGQAALFLSPASGSFFIGSTFDLSIVLDTKGVAVNTVEVELLFPADKIQVANPSVGASVVQLWTAPPSFSNQEGRVYFIGGIPSPGITISQGVILTLNFRVIAPGGGQISFGKKTSLFANDGRGTDILGQKPPAFLKFVIPPPQGPNVSSPTHPDQERWYKDNNPVFVWPKSDFSKGYSYIIDRDPAGFPDATIEGTESSASFQNIESGIWYFHLREKVDGIWGGVSHFVVKIDNQPPANFKANVSPGKITTNRSPIFRFFTTDALSGFDHFEMKVVPLSDFTGVQGLFFEVDSPYQSQFEPDRYQIIVRALDKAGNSRDEAVTLNIISGFYKFFRPEGLDLIFTFIPWLWILLFFGFLSLVFFIVLAVLWRRHRHHLGHAFREDIKNIAQFFRKSKPPQ